MATRKIRLTMSGNIINGQGPLVDIDFNNENLDVDIDIDTEHGVSNIVREYTVDAAAGAHTLTVTFKNDTGGEFDRNLYIENLEFSVNGTDYQQFMPTDNNTNVHYNLFRYGFSKVKNPNFNSLLPQDDNNNLYLINPDYNNTLPRSDAAPLGYVIGAYPGDNAKYIYEQVWDPLIIWDSESIYFIIDFD